MKVNKVLNSKLSYCKLKMEAKAIFVIKSIQREYTADVSKTVFLF